MSGLLFSMDLDIKKTKNHHTIFDFKRHMVVNLRENITKPSTFASHRSARRAWNMHFVSYLLSPNRLRTTNLQNSWEEEVASIGGGDFNAKHRYWGSRLITVIGWQLVGGISDNKLDYLQVNQRTYWPNDRIKS